MKTDPVDTSPTQPVDVGSDLCLRCGMCCRGVLHPDALLAENERPTAERFELTIATQHDGQAVFALPCNLHDHATNGCINCDKRLHVCRRYACDLVGTIRAGPSGSRSPASLQRTRRTAALPTAASRLISSYRPACSPCSLTATSST